MFELRKNTTKQQFLDYLIQEAHSAGQLHILIISLPSFLDSPLAVNIFLNQLKGYPRSIKWFTRDAQIFDILATSKLPLDAVHFDPPQISSEKGDYKHPDVVEVIEQTLLAGSSKIANPTIRIKTENLDTSAMVKVPTPVVAHSVSPQAQPVITPLVTEPLQTAKPIHTSAPLDEQNAGYQPLVVMHRGEVMSLPSHAEQVNQGENAATLDTWLQNIEKAKESINQVKKQSFFGTDPATKLREAFKQDAGKHIQRANRNAWIGRALLTGGAVTVIAGLIFGFGNTLFTPDVYTIAVKQERKEQPVNLSIATSDTKSLVFDTRTESTLTTTGKGQEGKAATGTISLINESSQTIALNNAGFYLQKGTVTYKVDKNTALPNTLSIPGGTNGNTFTFTVTANVEGAGTGLGSGERLTVRNLAGSLISDKLYASVVNEIKMPKAGNYVTQADIDALKKQNSDKNVQKITERSKTLSSTQIALAGLTETIVIKEDTNARINDTTESISMISDYKNTLFYIEEDMLKESVKKKVKTERVDAVKINTVEKSGNNVNINVLAIYFLPQEFQASEVTNLLENVSDVKITETMLKTKYPTIQSINQKKGFSLLRQDPVIKIELTQ